MLEVFGVCSAEPSWAGAGRVRVLLINKLPAPDEWPSTQQQPQQQPCGRVCQCTSSTNKRRQSGYLWQPNAPYMHQMEQTTVFASLVMARRSLPKSQALVEKSYHSCSDVGANAQETGAPSLSPPYLAGNIDQRIHAVGPKQISELGEAFMVGRSWRSLP